LPSEAVDLKDFVDNLNSKNVNKNQSDINKWKKEGIVRLKFAETLLPENDETSIKDLQE
jgi:hypothetical protein